MTFSLLVAVALNSAPPQTEVTVELKNCTDAQAEALFGVKGSGCLIYDVKKNEAKTEFEFCGGMMVGVALKIGGGVALEHHKIACVKITTTLNPSDAEAAKKVLGSDTADSKAIRELMKNEFIKELRKQGVDEKVLMKIKSIEFEPFKDSTKSTIEIRKVIDQCPPSKEIPNVS